jgi:hypothetical protein
LKWRGKVALHVIPHAKGTAIKVKPEAARRRG